LNVRGAFLVNQPEIIRGKKILLLDDVFTTGATLNECSRILKEAGAARVSVLTLARVVR
jgi:predicted amidophosphoribosyltransferase